jgi:ribose 5-phosphate isomerase B
VTDEERVREMVRRVVYQTVGRPAPDPVPRGRTLVTQRTLEDTPVGGELEIPHGAILTPLARQAALERRISLVEPGPAVGTQPTSRTARGGGPRTVAMGADHGGFELKELLKEGLRDLGYDVLDCGTGSTEPVDYPDFALSVAGLVAQGRAWRGILVDGAGIGSCMTANKVPGIRAAMCYDEATALNSREHNDANVLTLGAGLIGPGLARRIVETWLNTPTGGGRHARRVEKIMAIERRFLRA